MSDFVIWGVMIAYSQICYWLGVYMGRLHGQPPKVKSGYNPIPECLKDCQKPPPPPPPPAPKKD